MFFIGALIGAITAGLLFFYQVLVPANFETSALRTYSVPQVQTIQVQTTSTANTKNVVEMGGGWGGFVQMGGGWGGLVK